MVDPIVDALREHQKKYISAAELARIIEVSVTTLKKWGRDGTLPAPLRLSAHVVRWPVDVLIEHFARLGREVSHVR